MKIAILGYGKMGKMIESLAKSAGHNIVLKSTSQNPATTTELRQADIAIEFTTPDSAPENIRLCLDEGIPVVSGSTGWLDQLEDIKKHCSRVSGRLFYASNFSIGVNLFFKLNAYLAELMNDHTEYSPALKEWHHIHKKDAPSGTAVTLLEELVKKLDHKSSWSLGKEVDESQIPVEAIRQGEIFGTHQIQYQSKIDNITIQHEALGREGFAKGAILAAEWLVDKDPGLYNMNDFL